jgi:hypothetical protein
MLTGIHPAVNDTGDAQSWMIGVRQRVSRFQPAHAPSIDLHESVPRTLTFGDRRFLT